MDPVIERAVLITAMIDAMKSGGSSLVIDWGEESPEGYWEVSWRTSGVYHTSVNADLQKALNGAWDKGTRQP